MTEPTPPPPNMKPGLPRIVWLLLALIVAVVLWGGLFVLVRFILH